MLAFRMKAESMPHTQMDKEAHVHESPATHAMAADQEPATASIAESWQLGEGIDNPALEKDTVEKFVVT